MKKVLLVIPVIAGFIWLVPVHGTPVQQERVSILLEKGKVVFSTGGEQAGTYQYTGVPKPILFPAYAPGGIPMTRPWPMVRDAEGTSKDHEHHQSIWFCHGDVIPKGVEVKQKLRGIEGVDFWSVANGHGNIVCTSVKKGQSGGFWAGIDTTNEWQTADGMKIMDEKRSVTLYDFGKARLWIYEIDLHASVCPIIFGDTKEGAMALRVNDTISEKRGNGMMQNAKGQKKEKECWGQYASWCDYSGTINGQKVGIAILDDPNNVSPAAWHARGYGLMAANPFGRQKARFPAVKGKNELVELAKGEHLRLRYGVLIHQGGTEDGNVAGYFDRFLKLRKK